MYIVCVHTYTHYILSTVQEGFNPLYAASGAGYTEIVDALLRWGADPNQAITVLKTMCCSISLTCTVL